MIDASLLQTFRTCSRDSISGAAAFPEIVRRLAAVGCESYHADLYRQEKTYYLADGRSHAETGRLGSGAIADAFSAEGVGAAVRAIQAGRITYAGFLDLIRSAGCVGYFVHIAGRRALYLGRRGDSHLELFPRAD